MRARSRQAILALAEEHLDWVRYLGPSPLPHSVTAIADDDEERGGKR